jgi:hypothetical protein
MKKQIGLVVFVLIALLTSSSVFANSGMIVMAPTVELDESAQNAIVAWNGKEEIIILSKDVESSKSTLVLEVIPLPSNPEVDKGSMESFEKLVKIINEKTAHWEITEGGEEEAIMVGGVEVTLHKKIGAHDVTVVKVNDLDYFVSWVEKFTSSKGFENVEISKEFKATVKNYLDKNIKFFVFDVIETSKAKRNVEPLIYRFKTNYLYYPLEITATSDVGRSSSKINLFLITSEKIDRRLVAHTGLLPTLGFGYDFKLSEEEVKDVSPEIRDLFRSDPFLMDVSYMGPLNKLNRDLIVPKDYKQNLEGSMEWSQIFEFNASWLDEGVCAKQTKEGGYIVAGTARSNAFLMKADSNGEIEWNRTFGGPETDEAYAVQQTFDGGFIILGGTVSYGAGGIDAWLIKTDPEGNEEWNKTFGGRSADYGHSIQQTKDGGYVVAGTMTLQGNRCQLLKTDSKGNEEWNKTFGKSKDERIYAKSVQQTKDGGYIIVGTKYLVDEWDDDVWLIKTDSKGNEEWNKTFGKSKSEEGRSVQQTSDGGYIIVADTHGSWMEDVDMWLIKTDSKGREKWSKMFGSPDCLDRGYSVQQTKEGGYVIVGVTDSYSAGGWSDVWLIKTDSRGNEAWNTTYGGLEGDIGYSVQQTKDGGYIVAGRTNSFGAGENKVWLIKVKGGNTEPMESKKEEGKIFIPWYFILVLVGIVLIVGVWGIKRYLKKSQ